MRFPVAETNNQHGALTSKVNAQHRERPGLFYLLPLLFENSHLYKQKPLQAAVTVGTALPNDYVSRGLLNQTRTLCKELASRLFNQQDKYDSLPKHHSLEVVRRFFDLEPDTLEEKLVTDLETDCSSSGALHAESAMSLLDLPIELVDEIVHRVDMESLSALACVCQSLNNLTVGSAPVSLICRTF